MAALGALKLGAEEGFVLSRVDGRLTVGEICLLVPFEAEVTAGILTRLARAGAVEIPGSEVRAEARLEGLELTAEQARRIDDFFATLGERDAFELLEVTPDADKKEVKRAYFKLSKEFHPDRFFGKNIGPYRERLSKIFQSIKAAFDLLSDDDRRTAYLESARPK
jgi:DnaJ domain